MNSNAGENNGGISGDVLNKATDINAKKLFEVKRKDWKCQKSNFLDDLNTIIFFPNSKDGGGKHFTQNFE